MKLSILASLALLAFTSASPIEASEPLDRRAVNCLKVGATATATWTNAAGKTCRWTGVVGTTSISLCYILLTAWVGRQQLRHEQRERWRARHLIPYHYYHGLTG